MDAARFPSVGRVKCKPQTDTFQFEQSGVIGWGSNGGFQAVNLAAQFGVARIILVGFDMTLAHGHHWHGRHPAGLNNPREAGVERWRRELDAQAPALRARGIEVINASPISALEAYPKRDLLEALACKI